MKMLGKWTQKKINNHTIIVTKKPTIQSRIYYILVSWFGTHRLVSSTNEELLGIIQILHSKMQNLKQNMTYLIVITIYN